MIQFSFLKTLLSVWRCAIVKDIFFLGVHVIILNIRALARCFLISSHCSFGLINWKLCVNFTYELQTLISLSCETGRIRWFFVDCLSSRSANGTKVFTDEFLNDSFMKLSRKRDYKEKEKLKLKLIIKCFQWNLENHFGGVRKISTFIFFSVLKNSKKWIKSAGRQKFVK